MAADGKKAENKNEWGALLSTSSLGITMVVSTAVGLGMGIALDRWWGSAPWATLIFLIIGVSSGFWQIIKEIRKLNGNK